MLSKESLISAWTEETAKYFISCRGILPSLKWNNGRANLTTFLKVGVPIDLDKVFMGNQDQDTVIDYSKLRLYSVIGVPNESYGSPVIYPKVYRSPNAIAKVCSEDEGIVRINLTGFLNPIGLTCIDGSPAKPFDSKGSVGGFTLEIVISTADSMVIDSSVTYPSYENIIPFDVTGFTLEVFPTTETN